MAKALVADVVKWAVHTPGIAVTSQDTLIAAMFLCIAIYLRDEFSHLIIWDNDFCPDTFWSNLIQCMNLGHCIFLKCGILQNQNGCAS